MRAGLLAVQWLLVALLFATIVAFVAPVPQTAGDDVVWWRCEDCRRRWQTHGAGRVSTIGLRLRRHARRRARARAKDAPAWAAARGNRRCPTCLSRNIRPSRQR